MPPRKEAPTLEAVLVNWSSHGSRWISPKIWQPAWQILAYGYSDGSVRWKEM